MRNHRPNMYSGNTCILYGYFFGGRGQMPSKTPPPSVRQWLGVHASPSGRSRIDQEGGVGHELGGPLFLPNSLASPPPQKKKKKIVPQPLHNMRLHSSLFIVACKNLLTSCISLVSFNKILSYLRGDALKRVH